MKLLNKKGQAVLSPSMIMSIVVALIILAVGVYAFFTTENMIPKSSLAGYNEINNSTAVANQVFNILGIVLTIGAILLIVAMVYAYARPGGL